MQMTPLFGCIAPGRPLFSDFVPASSDGTKFVATLPVPPCTVTELTFFLFPMALCSLPPGHGVVLYYSVTPSNWTGPANWVVLGAVGADKPSGVFRTGTAEYAELYLAIM